MLTREDDPRIIKLLIIWEQAHGMWLEVQAAGQVNTPERAALELCAIALTELVGKEYNILLVSCSS